MRKIAIVSAVTAMLMMAGCTDKSPSGITVSDAVVRQNAAADGPAAGYMTLTGGGQDMVLVSISSPVAQRTEMHDVIRVDGVTEMKEIRSLQIPAGKVVAFRPGGKHIMLWTLNPRVQQSGEVALVLTFANGEEVVTKAKLEAPAAAADAGHNAHMQH